MVIRSFRSSSRSTGDLRSEQAMGDDVERSIDQLEVAMKIARCLANGGLVVYRCRYDFLAFGSWVIEAGTSHRRLQLVRDGQQRTLRYSTARLQNAGAVPEWQEQEVVPLDVVSAPADLDNWVTMLIRKYGTSAGNRPTSSAGH
jgi:hypothetical protein